MGLLAQLKVKLVRSANKVILILVMFVIEKLKRRKSTIGVFDEKQIRIAAQAKFLPKQCHKEGF
jgi:hypothetical protein